MLFRILGPVAVDGVGGGEVALGGPRHRALLATLLLSPGDVVSMDRLAETLWGDDPPRRAAELVHVRVSELRRSLRDGGAGGRDLIVTRRPGYLLQPDELDARHFLQAAAAGRRALEDGRASAAVGHLTAALGWWRGPALPELADRPIARAAVARWESLRRQVEADRIDAELAAGHHHTVLAELETLVGADPLDERHRRRLMLALYRDGRQRDALAVYDEAAALLRDELGIDPGPELADTRLAILRHEHELLGPLAAAVRAGAARIGPPAPLTSFVGRRDELAAVRRCLTGARLVTLTGVGGAGKSRLAAELARTATLPAHVVELAATADPGLVPATVAAALGVRERPRRPLTDAVADHLAAPALLVLDNCEHVLDAVADLAGRLLGSCPDLRVLCTSRERLGVTGETVRPVPGLGVPADGAERAVHVLGSDAARLFSDRARAVRPGFRVTDGNAAAVAEVCRRLDGLPLAVELAAARTSAFAPAQIVERLDDRFRLLSYGSREALPRHRTLRAVVDWSHDLLDEPERRLFRRLGVFAGGFTLAAAEAVCADPGARSETAGLLARLVDKSLVTAGPSGDTYRYHLLETLRAYALDELADVGETGRARAAHGVHYRAVAVEATAGLRTDRLVTWLDRLRTEHDNLRAAMEWSLGAGEDETAALIAVAAHKLWELEARYREGRSWLARVLEDGRTVAPAVRAWAFFADAVLASLVGDGDATVTGCAQAVRLAHTCGDAAVAARAHALAGFWAIACGTPERGLAVLAEAERVAGDDPWACAWVLYFRSTAALVAGRWAEAARCSERALEQVGERGDGELRAWTDLNLGQALQQLGEERAALGHSARALRAFRDLRVARGICFAVIPCAAVLVAQGSGAAATRLLGGGEGVRVRTGTTTVPFIAAWVDDAVTLLRTRLTPAEFDAEWRRGEAMTLDEIARTALAELDRLR